MNELISSNDLKYNYIYLLPICFGVICISNQYGKIVTNFQFPDENWYFNKQIYPVKILLDSGASVSIVPYVCKQNFKLLYFSKNSIR